MQFHVNDLNNLKVAIPFSAITVLDNDGKIIPLTPADLQNIMNSNGFGEKLSQQIDNKLREQHPEIIFIGQSPAVDLSSITLQ